MQGRGVQENISWVKTGGYDDTNALYVFKKSLGYLEECKYLLGIAHGSRAEYFATSKGYEAAQELSPMASLHTIEPRSGESNSRS